MLAPFGMLSNFQKRAVSPEVNSEEPTGFERFRRFVTAFGELLHANPKERLILAEGQRLLASLIRTDDWLPERYARPDPDRYQQYLLHCDSRERFSVVSFVWGPGQRTPIHNHRIWGLVGVLRGAERVESFRRTSAGLSAEGPPQVLNAGDVDAVSPRIGDIHRVANALDDQTSISIHVYGANIGAIRRSVFAEDGTSEPFVSGYAQAPLPNIWQPPS